jgi:nucleotide-binding universal stress UspA family protein
MFKKLLLPVDLTDKHGPALAAAADLACQSQGEVVLLHVIEVIPGLPREEERAFYDRLERKARAHLERLGERLGNRKIPWRAEILYGNRGQEALGYATATSIDLIVLTSPRVEPANPTAGWGSLSYKIGVLCPCPVLLVK